jgi:hypothetical protein
MPHDAAFPFRVFLLQQLDTWCLRISDDETILGWSPASERKLPANHRAVHD